MSNFFNGKKIISCHSGKLSTILDTISEKYPSFRNKFYEPYGKLKEYVTLVFEDKIVSNNDLESIYVKDNQKIRIYVPLMGG